jgi:hypothetical protein
MTKKATRAEFNTFVKGLITEASPLNFPENASADEENFELNRDGSRDRRLGLGFEPDAVVRNVPVGSSTFLSSYTDTFEWTNVGGDSSRSFLVCQFDNTLEFFDLHSIPLSALGYVGTVILTGLNSSGKQHSFAGINGNLVVAAGVEQIAIVKYDGVNFSVSYEVLKVRDLWGVEHAPTDADPTLRPTAPTNNYLYNLYNQSWGVPRRTNALAFNSVPPLVEYQTYYAKFPSNSESVWLGIQTIGRPHPEASYDKMVKEQYGELTGVSTTTARGYFIIDLLRRGQSRSQAIANNAAKYPVMNFTSFTPNADFTEGGATTVCEYAGRVCYAGFNGKVTDGDAKSPDLSSMVFFSQLVKNTSDITKCYQEGDPTSRDTNDVVDTDGGFVRVSAAEGITHIMALGTQLIVFAKNGVFSISGGSDYGFTATNYKVDTICEFGVLNRNSIVKDGGRAFYWSLDGIYALVKNQMGMYDAQNLTQTTIQSFYDDISLMAKEGSKGVYDSVTKKIRWLYKEGEEFTSASITRELILDLTLQAFYKNRQYNIPGTEVMSAFRSTPFEGTSSIESVIAGSDFVYADVEPVVVNQEGRSSGLLSTRYLQVSLQGDNPVYTFGYYNNPQFRDWADINGTGNDATAFMITGEMTGGDSSIQKQVPYVFMHFTRTETGVDTDLNPLNQSSCFLRMQWDWSNTSNSNKWSPQAQAYRYPRPYLAQNSSDPYDTGFKVITTKNKIRGRGQALALRIDTEEYKDCRLLGWNINLNANRDA